MRYLIDRLINALFRFDEAWTKFRTNITEDDLDDAYEQGFGRGREVGYQDAEHDLTDVFYDHLAAELDATYDRGYDEAYEEADAWYEGISDGAYNSGWEDGFEEGWDAYQNSLLTASEDVTWWNDYLDEIEPLVLDEIDFADYSIDDYYNDGLPAEVEGAAV